jgi:hypothetical protein
VGHGQVHPRATGGIRQNSPQTFVPVAGKCGLKGSTNVRLSEADKVTLKSALMTAWNNVALKPSKKREGPVGAGSRRVIAGENLHDTFARVRAALKKAKLPEVEESISFGTLSMKVRGKFLMRVKDQNTLVFRCPIEEKSLLVAAAPDVYFETDHYRGWPTILVRLAKISDAKLKHCLERAWRLQTPATSVRRFYGATAVRSKSLKRRHR